MIYSPKVSQYGFRENCSTHHALTDIVDKIQLNFNKKILFMLNIYKSRKSHDIPYQCPKGEILPSVLTVEESVSLKL